MKFLLCILRTICGKCCAGHLERILGREKDGDLFIFKTLSFGKASSNRRNNIST